MEDKEARYIYRFLSKWWVFLICKDVDIFCKFRGVIYQIRTNNFSKMGFCRKNIVEDIEFFEVDRPGFPVTFTVRPSWNFSFFCIESPGNPCFFSQFLVYPPGIAMTFTLPPGIFHWYPQQGVTIFFLKSPISIQRGVFFFFVVKPGMYFFFPM